MLKCEWQGDFKMNNRIVKNNIKNALFFSYSIICSTVFFVVYLGLKNEYWDTEKEIDQLEYSKIEYSNKIKSLKRQKNILIQSVEQVAYDDYGFITPDPEPFIILIDE